MKRGLHWFSICVAVLGALFAVFNLWGATTTPPIDELHELLKLLHYTVAAAQIAPIAGLWFGREALTGADAKAWNKQRRAGFVLWVTTSIPALLLGALSALTVLL